eukprot:GGOE01043127.1.p1 GENE.GGOE01043127.1~~GGOE01043127.1.p1  ORF type:complete len:1240 (+),score=432.52 GGOE01043127.1:52-3771(+)
MGKEKAGAAKGEEVRIRCYARVRPTWPHELERPGVYESIEIEDTHTIRLNKGSKLFEFDKVFDNQSSQEEIFTEVAVPLIENAFQGYHGTLFCYGQTGTGKTHTISSRVPGEEGIIPKAIDYIYKKIGNSQDYLLKFNYVQLYRDNIEDLMQRDAQGNLRRIDLWRDETVGADSVLLKDLVTVDVESKHHFYSSYELGFANKTMAETAMNSNSSRGHALLLLHIIRKQRTEDLGTNATLASIEAQKQLNGKLIFADLAGYERIKKSMVSGIRKDEATSINLSLTALGNVIHALTNKASHVPWRNSKLTRLLQDALGGNSMTAVIVTMNNLSEHITETVNTLYFGYNAMQCKTTKRLDTGPIDYRVHYIKLQAAYKVLESEKQALEDELEAHRALGSGKDAAEVIRAASFSASREYDREIEGYVDVIDEARTALETEVEKNAELQKKINELNTAIEEKDLEEAAFYDEVQQHLEELTAQLEAKTAALQEKTAEVERLTQQVAKLNAENEELAEGTEDFIQENEQLQAALGNQKKIMEALQDKNNGHQKLMAMIATMEDAARERARERQALETKCLKMDAELQRLRGTTAASATAPAMAHSPAVTAGGSAGAVTTPSHQAAGDAGAFSMQDKASIQASAPTVVANPVLSSLLEQFTSDQAVLLEDSDDEESCPTAPPQPRDRLNSVVSTAPEAMRALEYNEAEDDAEPDEIDKESTAPQVRWVSWNSRDPSQSYKLWTRVLEEVQNPDFRVSYHTTMKDVSEYLAVCDTSGTGRADHSEISVNPLRSLRRESLDASSTDGTRRMSGSWQDTGLHVNHPDAISRAESDPTWPRVSHPVIRGRLLVDTMLTAQAEYSGGIEGRSRLRWYRVEVNPKSGEEVFEVVAENRHSYRLQPEDAGCFILFEYVPVRKDGAVGSSVISRSPDPIFAGVPTAKNLRIEGNCFALQTVWVSYKYSGGAEEGPSIIRWFKSVDGYVFYEINKLLSDSQATNSSLYLSADLAHHYLRVLVVPISKDGTRGKPSHSKLVYINVDEVIDRSIRDLVTKGEVAFNVRLCDAKTAEEQRLIIHMDGKKFRVFKKPTSDKSSRHLLFALQWTSHIQLLRHGNSDTKLLLREVHKHKATSVKLAVENRNERDLLLLAFRAFYTMAQSNVTGVMLGDSWKDWQKGKWKEKAFDKRVQILERQLALEGPQFEKYHPKHRPGSLPTFLHRMEEIFIEGELDMISSTKVSKKPYSHRLPFPMD